MAKKGQKFQKYTEEFKQEIFTHYSSGIPTSVLSKRFKVPEQTISTPEYQ
ncbi:MAG: hypothetical protein LBI13_06785 [Streptococcaceae bacterium]|nr:hypothetical protein [Streptococcaceae bacterium]